MGIGTQIRSKEFVSKVNFRQLARGYICNISKCTRTYLIIYFRFDATGLGSLPLLSNYFKCDR